MLYSPQHKEEYEINAFYAEIFIFFIFFMVIWLQMSLDYGNSFSNQIALECWKLKFSSTTFVNFHITKATLCKFVEICTDDFK